MAGYYGGKLDRFLNELINIFLMLPTFFLIIMVVAIFGSSMGKVTLVIGLTSWMGTAKIMNAQTKSLKERTFVKAGKVLGENDRYVLFRYIVPHGIFPVLANVSQSISSAILFEASLSFLGLGDPNVMSWGQIIYLAHRPHSSKREVAARAKDLFDLVNLDDWVYRAYPHELSGGMMQRVNIALSLMLEPDLLIMDEATTALDVLTEKQILEELLAIEQKVSLTRIMITHDVSVVASSCQEVLVMYAGCLLEQGPVDQVFAEPYHPYTEGLLSSFPDLSQRGQRLQGIPGSLPDLREEGKACPFADRCPSAQDLCYEEKPLLTPVPSNSQVPAGGTADSQRYVACHFPRRYQDD